MKGFEVEKKTKGGKTMKLRENTVDSGKKFKGLAATNSPYCFIDGNGNGGDSWYNCVCSTDRWDGGIPAWDGSIATRMRLWIEIPGIVYLS